MYSFEVALKHLTTAAALALLQFRPDHMARTRCPLSLSNCAELRPPAPPAHWTGLCGHMYIGEGA
mgnify:CR=1 FL=1